LLRHKDSYISEVTKLEVLGYHKFDAVSKQIMTDLFDTLQIIPINSKIVDQAVLLKQTQKMSIGDAIIAATAILNNYEIVTRNVSYFQRFKLRVSNPII
jgi:toxin FitB